MLLINIFMLCYSSNKGGDMQKMALAAKLIFLFLSCAPNSAIASDNQHSSNETIGPDGKGPRNVDPKYRPTRPIMIVNPMLPGGKHIIDDGIAPKQHLKAECNAKLGKPGKGIIYWKVYRNGHEHNLTGGGYSIEVEEERSVIDDVESLISRVDVKMWTTKFVEVLFLQCIVYNEDFPEEVVNGRELCQKATGSGLCMESRRIMLFPTGVFSNHASRLGQPKMAAMLLPYIVINLFC